MKTLCAFVVCFIAFAAAVPACNKLYHPVCGVDGHVYNNDCLLRNAHVDEDVAWNSCKGHPLCPQICTLEYMPVCGPDGVIYGNRCAMQGAFCGRIVAPRPLSDCDH